MTEELNEHTFPNGGWKFRQPQTAWTNPMSMVGFKASVDAIVKHRLANPAITAKHSLATDWDVVAEELKAYTRLRLGMPDPKVSFFQQRPHNPLKDGAAAGDVSLFQRVARLGTGIRTLADWLPDGKTVPQELADKRATTCVTCPQHKTGNWLDMFVAPVANLLKKQLEEREKLNLKTSQDDKLNFCDACGCPLKTKVHIPIEYIRKHMKQPEIDRLDPRCWVLSEK